MILLIVIVAQVIEVMSVNGVISFGLKKTVAGVLLVVGVAQVIEVVLVKSVTAIVCVTLVVGV